MSNIRSFHNPVLTVINKSENHPIVVNITDRELNSTFCFKSTNKSEVREILKT